jgi:hypothetical protein
LEANQTNPTEQNQEINAEEGGKKNKKKNQTYPTKRTLQGASLEHKVAAFSISILEASYSFPGLIATKTQTTQNNGFVQTLFLAKAINYTQTTNYNLIDF